MGASERWKAFSQVWLKTIPRKFMTASLSTSLFLSKMSITFWLATYFTCLLIVFLLIPVCKFHDSRDYVWFLALPPLS